MPQHFDTVLPLLSQCASARDALPLRAALATAFEGLGLATQRAALLAASSDAELRVTAAKLLRELMAGRLAPEGCDPSDDNRSPALRGGSPRPAEPPAPEAPRPTRDEKKRARAAHAQRRALAEHKAEPERPIQQPIETLSGVGESIGQALRARGISTLGDLIWLLPLGYADERRITPLAELQPGIRQVTEGTVLRAAGRTGRLGDVLIEDGRGGQLRLVWFRTPYGLQTRFAPGMRYRVSGIVESYRNRLQIAHPETERLAAGESAAPRGVVPRYPVIAGVPPRRLHAFVQQALKRALHDLDEALPESVRTERDLGTLSAAVAALHAPPANPSDEELVLWNEARTRHHARLAFEEFFLLELALFKRRVFEQGVVAEPLQPRTQKPIERVREAFGFELTAAQRRVAEEIFADLARDRPMRRLLQGDVGSGKTAVALLAAAQCISAGAQVAFMAPTEVLAEQHFRSLAPLSKALGLRAALMLGSERESHRKKSRKALADGAIDLVVGTHALLAEGVRFARLRLAVIDEQHRFGVGQRLRLLDKTENGLAPHLLVMTATPIPRTLSLALYGDLAVSVIDQMPEGRIPPVTREYPRTERDRALAQLERALAAGGQAFVVCPVIEESDEYDARAAEQTHAELSTRLASYGVELLHGRLPPADKQSSMERFARGEARVLVSTTIVEVGIDVPRANVILIENAERFGLAQLHQLRGRVGRGGQRSACLLVHQATGEEARARMAAMCETSDGFRIAEEDLRLRGPGELFGHRQSGLPGFRYGDLRRDAPLLAEARDAAQAIIERDPALEAEAHAGLRSALERYNQGSRRVVKEEAG